MSGSAADGPALSLDQLRRELWADESLVVYAVILGSRVEGLRERLASAEVDDWDALWTGELDNAELDAAPHLVRLRRESPFSDWLAAEAAKAYPDWGLFVRSKLPFLAMRTRGRALCRAEGPDGEALRLDWADAATLLAVLPLAPREQLERVFDSIHSFVIAGSEAWLRLSNVMGRLALQRQALLAAA